MAVRPLAPYRPSRSRRRHLERAGVVMCTQLHATARQQPAPGRLIYLYVKLFVIFSSAAQGDPVFETFAAVSTIGFIIVFVALFQANRAASRSEDNAGN